MVDGDSVQQLGAKLRLQGGRALLDEPQAEVDVAQQPAFVGDAERRAALELDRPADVVQQRCREHEIGSQPRV
jgi:hypothetical protein